MISRVLHAGYIFEHRGVRVLFDPIFENPFSTNCYAYPPVHFNVSLLKQLHFDAVFISHFHDDHCSLESLALLSRKTPIYLYCHHEELFDWLRQLGFKKVFALRLDETIAVSDILITPHRALDSDVDTIFAIRCGSLQILNMVDAEIDETSLELLANQAPWDLILWPFQIMRERDVLSPLRNKSSSQALPLDWATTLQKLRPRAVIPSACQFIHEEWSWYRSHFFPISYKGFQQFVSKHVSACDILRLDPGETLLLDSNCIERGHPLSWIQRLTTEIVDYDFSPDAAILSTAQVAQHLPALDENGWNILHEFCLHQITKRFESLGPPADVFFQKRRRWRLSLFDHRGHCHEFVYDMQDEFMSVANDSQQPVDWTTDIPAYKLYQALFNGETLSSIYIRINESFFTKDVERALETVDLIEDPLLRVLYTGNFAPYQRAQWQRLLKKQDIKGISSF